MLDTSAFNISDLTVSSLRSSTPILLAILGETLTQRVGIINLGVEGQMLVGALAGFAATLSFGNPWIGLLVGALAGVVMSSLHAGLCVGLKANQIASGIAVLILGMGLTSFYGIPYVGQKIHGFHHLLSAHWQTVPILGTFVSQLTPTVIIGLIATPLVGIWLYRTRTGLIWRSVGESVQVARATGINPAFVQVQGVLIGGFFSGFAGAAMSVDYTRDWVENMTGGRGLVAVGLVIVARWNPFLALPAALLFGGSEAFYLRLQTAGVAVSPYLLATIPYVVTLLVLLVSYYLANKEGGAPQGLTAIFR